MDAAAAFRAEIAAETAREDEMRERANGHLLDVYRRRCVYCNRHWLDLTFAGPVPACDAQPVYVVRG